MSQNFCDIYIKAGAKKFFLQKSHFFSSSTTYD